MVLRSERDFDQLLLSVVQGTKGTSTLAIEPDFPTERNQNWRCGHGLPVCPNELWGKIHISHCFESLCLDLFMFPNELWGNNTFFTVFI